MEYTIKLTQQEIQVIQMGLGELPLKLGINLLGKLQREVAKQDAEKAIPLDQMSFDNSGAPDPDIASAIGCHD